MKLGFLPRSRLNSRCVKHCTVMDYLYSDEGAMLKNYGLTAEQAADSTLYQELGFTEGAYYYNEDGAFCQHEKILFNYQLPIMGIERTYFLLSTCSTINAPISSREIAKLIFTSP